MKLTFKEIVNREITKEKEVWRGDFFEITKFKNGSIAIEKLLMARVILECDVFTLVKEEVSLNEALEALEEGKEIESVASKYTYLKDGKTIFVYDTDGECIEDIPEEIAWISTKEAKGKWYIND